MQWHEECLPHHPNAMTLIAHGHGSELYRNTFYSVGGGFVIDEQQAQAGDLDTDITALPYDFNTAAELLALCRMHSMRISELMMANEKAWRDEADIRAGLWRIWGAMRECVDNGVSHEGVLPGGLTSGVVPASCISACWRPRMIPV
ncbi:serine dehydratase beta chain [Modicisalibacter luteus]|uniref:serine dehydratase beta chain n=1 Tax=Modicisalibacter luteus TaxID=453962 RepID=UPI003636C361